MSDIVSVNEAAKQTGRAPGTIRAYMRDFPEIKVRPGFVNLPALENVIAEKVGGDFRAVSRVRGHRPTLGPASASETLGTVNQLAEIRLRKEEASLEKVAIGNARAAGDLVRLADAKALLASIVIAARQRLESIPGKLGHQLEGRPRREIELSIALEIEAALSELSAGQTAISEAFS